VELIELSSFLDEKDMWPLPPVKLLDELLLKEFEVSL
jgi:hypothetical protein